MKYVIPTHRRSRAPSLPRTVTPAQAGAQIPTFVGMTKSGDDEKRG